MNKIKLICVDLQKDFSAEGGKYYHPHKNVPFIKETLVPFLQDHNIKVAEIISDYRQPRPGDRSDSCNPGTIGYESELPEDIKLQPTWIKCMNNPIWTRGNIGVASSDPGLPYEDPAAFDTWLNAVVGKPEETDVVLLGLTIDRCVLCTAQELSMRGYKVYVLEEGVDVYSGIDTEKIEVLNSPILKNWGKVIPWDELKQRLSRP